MCEYCKKIINNKRILDMDNEELKETRKLNGSDKNVACMEEDIKLVGNLIKEYRLYGDLDGIAINDMSVYINAMEHLIKAYKELEEERQIVGMPVRNKRDGIIGTVLHQWKSGSVAVLESINPRVINTHDSWNTLEIVTDEVKQTQTKCETIPVSLVEEKIEELKEEIEQLRIESNITYDSGIYRNQIKIEILQELLEKR